MQTVGTTGHHRISQNNTRPKPYEIHKVQALLPPDMDSRIQFCARLLAHQNPRAFSKNVLWTDESTFTRNGMWNRHNSHIWAESNPRSFQETGHQVRCSVNVWGGIHQGKILGPEFLHSRMNGESYLGLLTGPIANILAEVPLAQLRGMWFQHDGAPPHIARSARKELSREFPNRWIGRFGPRGWSPRSPDLTPLDFFLWGYVKGRVFDCECDTAEEMRARISTVFRELNMRSAEDPRS